MPSPARREGIKEILARQNSVDNHSTRSIIAGQLRVIPQEGDGEDQSIGGSPVE
jgi:hypothetical protein